MGGSIIVGLHSGTRSMTDERLRRRRPRVAPFLVSLLLVGTSACGQNDLQPELIPGTERIMHYSNGPWFTISPDERWMAFMEVDSADWDVSTRPDRPLKFHLVTLDLRTHAKTHHHIRDIPPKVFRSQIKDPWRVVQVYMVTAGWSSGRFFVPVPRSTRIQWIVFTPGAEAAAESNPPPSQECLDCVPPDSLSRIRERYGLNTSVEAMVAFGDGSRLGNLYREASRGDGASLIERVRRTGTEVVCVESRSLRDTYIERIRVSPDEEYLAYRLTIVLKSPIPLPPISDEVVIRQVGGDVVHSIRYLFSAGNIIWSRDSRRVYCSVNVGEIADGDGDGVYVIRLRERQHETEDR
jgi:hypothetical protein